MMATAQAWDILVEDYGVSDETLRVVTAINGYSMDTMESVLYAIAGYQDFDQAAEEEDE